MALSLEGQSHENRENFGEVGCGVSCRREDATGAELELWPMGLSDGDPTREEADSEGTSVTSRNSGAARARVSAAEKARM